MHFTQKLTYMGFGCLLTLAGYILAGMNNDSVAQSGVQDVTFGEITCRELTVIDDDGKKGVVLRTSERGGIVLVKGKDGGFVILSTDKHGGFLHAVGKVGGGVQIGNKERDGSVLAKGKGGGSVQLDSGSMAIFNKGGKNVL